MNIAFLPFEYASFYLEELSVYAVHLAVISAEFLIEKTKEYQGKQLLNRC